MFAIKAAISDPRAEAFAFSEQKTMHVMSATPKAMSWNARGHRAADGASERTCRIAIRR